jgi:murein DD-endopeptidase MepM/ murein hydrolase activator NlpD
MKFWTKARTCAVAALLAVICVLTAAPSRADDTSGYKQELNQLNSRYDTLEKQQQQIQAEINRAKSEKDRQLAVKKQLDNQIYNTRQQITILSEKITLLEAEISEKELQIEAKQQEIDQNYVMLKDRLRAMYTAGNATVLGLVLGAENFAQFLTRAEVASRISEHDQVMIDSLVEARNFIDEERIQIVEDKAEIESSKTQMAQKEAELGVQVKATESQIQDIAALEAEYQKNAAKLKQEMDELQSEIDKIYAQISSEGEYAGGKLGWPVKGFTLITSDYGWRFNRTDFHTGFDIAGKNAAGNGIYGQNVLSAHYGRVVFTQTSYVPGKGYGIYIIVDHGGGISTLYAHLSQILVKAGDTVERGQAIGKVGSTGWSTGPHLHFEVRVNGKYTYPWDYINRP